MRWQSWIFSIITPVFSVTWSFRNDSNLLICCSRHFWEFFNVLYRKVKGTFRVVTACRGCMCTADATLLFSYFKAESFIQSSWNCPFYSTKLQLPPISPTGSLGVQTNSVSSTLGTIFPFTLTLFYMWIIYNARLPEPRVNPILDHRVHGVVPSLYERHMLA